MFLTYVYNPNHATRKERAGAESGVGFIADPAAQMRIQRRDQEEKVTGISKCCK